MPDASTWAPEAAVAKQFGASEGASGAVAELCWHPIALDGPAVHALHRGRSPARRWEARMECEEYANKLVELVYLLGQSPPGRRALAAPGWIQLLFLLLAVSPGKAQRRLYVAPFAQSIIRVQYSVERLACILRN